MLDITFFDNPLAMHAPRYAIVCVRHAGTWYFCRKKEKKTWELPGGHIEKGETPEAAARRELWEETGIRKCSLMPVSEYRIDDCGMLFFAETDEPPAPPAEYEMAEVRAFSVLPRELSYPLWHARMFAYVQNWLNMRSGAGEPWDLYDTKRRLVERTICRGEAIPEGLRHLVVHIWIRGRDGKYLITRRAPTKGYPNLWETTGGSALRGDASISAALREVREETGVALDPRNGHLLLTTVGKDFYCDIWHFLTDVDPATVTLLPGETSAADRASLDEISEKMANGQFVPIRDFNRLKRKLEEDYEAVLSHISDR